MTVCVSAELGPITAVLDRYNTSKIVCIEDGTQEIFMLGYLLSKN